MQSATAAVNPVATQLARLLFRTGRKASPRGRLPRESKFFILLFAPEWKRERENRRRELRNTVMLMHLKSPGFYL